MHGKFQYGFPGVTLLLTFLIIIPIILMLKSVVVSPDNWDCRISIGNVWNRLTGFLVGGSFILLLMLVSINYVAIVRHVQRKFSQRKARRRKFSLN